jgi:uncharacterized integral membrane protein
MSLVHYVFLVLLAAAVALFAYFNQEPVAVNYWDYSVTTNVAVTAGIAYLLGVVSGGTLLRMVAQSARSVADAVRRELAQQQA